MSEEEIINTLQTLSEEIKKRKFSNKSTFNKKIYEKYKKTPITSFPCRNGVIKIGEILSRNILISINHLTQELDALLLFVGREGSGKSLFMRQVLYMFWFYLRELGLIDYEFTLELVHFGIKELQEDRQDYDSKGLKYRISDLDESKDDLGRDKHSDPKAQGFLNYIRRNRDECGVTALAQPQLSEFLPSIVLSRALAIFIVDYDIDIDGNITRGEYKVIFIPRGKTSYSSYLGKPIKRDYIKVKLGEFMHNPKLRYAELPNDIISIKGRFNSIDPSCTKAYLEKKRKKKWERMHKEEQEKSDLKKEVKNLRNYRDYYLKLLSIAKNLKVTNKSLASGLGVSTRTIDRHISEGKEYDK